MGNIRKCNYCGKEYTVYDSDAGSYKEWFCSELCEQAQEDFIDEQLERLTEVKLRYQIELKVYDRVLCRDMSGKEPTEAVTQLNIETGDPKLKNELCKYFIEKQNSVA